MFTAKYTFKINVFHLDSAVPIETLEGQVEAERYSHACIKAWKVIEDECKRIQQETKQQTGVGNLLVERSE